MKEQQGKQEPFALILVGATGDLARRKIWPSLWALFRQGRLPDAFSVIGMARRDHTDASYRSWIASALSDGASPTERESTETFLGRVFYHRADIDADPDAFTGVRRRLEKHEGDPKSRLFYLAVNPDLFGPVITRLAEAGLIRAPSDPAWTRVVIEKPFGRDRDSAQALNRLCLDRLDESQIYRIDHYLGKETVQNMLSFRFGNTIFEPLFNNRFVQHVQITAAETVGMGNERGAYYDRAGALRDMVQNHLLQLLCLAAMEPPAQMTADAIRSEKVKVLRSVRLPATDVRTFALPGQYEAGRIGDAEVSGFRDEPRVRPDSRTPTYAALRLHIENWRWAGVPFYVRTGKRMAGRATEIVVRFRAPPLQLFQTVECVDDVCDLAQAKPNRLIFRIQPREGISLRFSAKRPATALRVEDVEMHFSYADAWPGRVLPDAYERLLLDVVRGDSTLFTRSDEVEEAWRIVQPVLDAWEGSDGVQVYPYPAGSWGPPEAASLFSDSDADWHVPETSV